MMPVDEVCAPTGFREAIHDPGMDWLAKPANAQKEPPDYWNTRQLPNGKTCRESLYESYHGICAYSLFRIVDGMSFQVDHFLPKSDPQYRQYAYDWNNYRLSGPAWNARKHAADVSDPFKIPQDVCQLIFPECIICFDETYGNRGAREKADLEKLKMTVDQLELNKGFVRTNRENAYRSYNPENPQDGMGINQLTINYPFVAYEMLRQGYLRPDDVDACRNTLHNLGFSWA